MSVFPVATIVEGGPGSGHHSHGGLKGVWGGSSRRRGAALNVDVDGQLQLPFGGGRITGKKEKGVLARRRLFIRDTTKSRTHRVLKVLNNGIHETAKVEIISPSGRKYEACRKRTGEKEKPLNALTIEAVASVMGSNQVPATVLVQKKRPSGDPLSRGEYEPVEFLFTKWMPGIDFDDADGQKISSVPYEEWERMVILDIVTKQRDRHGKNFNIGADGKLNLTDNDFMMTLSEAENASVANWKNFTDHQLFGSDLGYGTVRRTHVGRVLHNKVLSPEGRAMLNRLTSKAGQRRLKENLAKIHGGKWTTADTYVKAFVHRARALGKRGRRFNFGYCT